MSLQANLWYYTPGWLRLFLWQFRAGAAADVQKLYSIRRIMNGKHYCIRLR